MVLWKRFLIAWEMCKKSKKSKKSKKKKIFKVFISRFENGNVSTERGVCVSFTLYYSGSLLLKNI